MSDYSDYGKLLDGVIELTAEENQLIFEQHKKKAAWFADLTPNVETQTIEYHQLSKMPYKDVALRIVLTEAIEQMDLFLVKFPQHVKPPEHLFKNTISSFMNRRAMDQFEIDYYCKLNAADLNVAKLHVEYTFFIKCIVNLLETFHVSHSFKKFHSTVNEMLELESFLINLEKENVDNIEYLRKRELHLIQLCQSKKTVNEFRAIDSKYQQIENDYHDTRVTRARQLRFNKKLFNAQMNQIKKRENNKSNNMVDESNDLIRNCEIEQTVFEESSRYNLSMINQYKRQIIEVNEKYDNDLIHIEFEVTRAQSELNYFEEMWERKVLELEFMKIESENYIESVRQRKREKIAKRLAQTWIASARKTIADRQRKAKRLAKKNKTDKRKK